MKNANNKSGNIKVKSKVPILGIEPFVIYSENLVMINMNTSVRIEISRSVRHEKAGTQLKGQLRISIQSMPQLLMQHDQIRTINTGLHTEMFTEDTFALPIL